MVITFYMFDENIVQDGNKVSAWSNQTTDRQGDNRRK